MRFVDADGIEKELGVEDRDLYVQHILDSAPTIEAEPIVRCKDCKHNGTEDCIAYNAYFVQPEDWFCGNGKRKEE